MNLVGVREIADMLGTTRQYASQLGLRRDFPEPVAELAMGKVWERDDVVAWAKRTGRAIVTES